jgi:hypothetical protein
MTRPDDLPAVIPGQMTVDEVIEEMTDGPRKASDVDPETDLSAEELAAQKRRKTIAGRIAKKKALKNAGADVATTNPDLAARLEDGLERRKQESFRKARIDRDTKRLVQSRLKGKP